MRSLNQGELLIKSMIQLSTHQNMNSMTKTSERGLHLDSKRKRAFKRKKRKKNCLSFPTRASPIGQGDQKSEREEAVYVHERCDQKTIPTRCSLLAGRHALQEERGEDHGWCTDSNVCRRPSVDKKNKGAWLLLSPGRARPADSFGDTVSELPRRSRYTDDQVG